MTFDDLTLLEDEQEAGTRVCSKHTVEWDIAPDLGNNDGILSWFGVCECGQSVYEIYVQQDELFNADTNETIQDR